MLFDTGQKILRSIVSGEDYSLSARPNHYLDCEVYAYVAADVCNVRLLQEQKIEVPQARQESSGGYTYSPFGR